MRTKRTPTSCRSSSSSRRDRGLPRITQAEIDGLEGIIEASMGSPYFGRAVNPTQFLGPDGVTTRTALSYINELATKYASGSRIASTASVPDGLKNTFLQGQLVLEVPVQKVPIVEGDPICEAAADAVIVIRDYLGRVYCL